MDKLTKFTNAHVDGQRKFNWRFAFIFAGPALATIILFITSFVSPIPPKWLTHAMFYTFVPMIFLSMFLTQKAELTGSYGETILLLIPTFVWLLPGHVAAIKNVQIIALSLILIGALFYVLGLSLVLFKKQSNDKRIRSVTPILLRLTFVASTIVSTLIVSILLINWGDQGMGLAPSSIENMGQADYTSSSWIIFIAVVTILVALSLVFLGLLASFQSHFSSQNERTIAESIKLRVKKRQAVKGVRNKNMVIRVSAKKASAKMAKAQKKRDNKVKAVAKIKAKRAKLRKKRLSKFHKFKKGNE